MRAKLLLLLFFLTAVGSSGFAFSAPSENDPSAEFRSPKSHGVRRFLLLPLELPSYVFRIATWPVLVGARAIEKHRIAEKAVALLSNDEKTFWVYPLVEIGAGSGFGAGVGLHHSDLFHKGYGLGFQGVVFFDQDFKTALSFTDPRAFEIGGRPVSYTLKLDYLRESDEDFYGQGPASRRADRSDFGYDDIGGGVSFTFRPVDHFEVTPHVFGRAGTSRTSPGANPPSAETLFPAADLPGFDRWLTHVDVGVTLSHDTRDAKASPQRGGLRSFTFRRFQGVGQKDFDYHEYRLDVRQFIPLWAPGRVLVLRNAWTFQQETGRSAVPFYRESFLDLNTPLRGFDRGRFRDHGSVIFNAEYRYPVWDLIEGTIFFDTGRVFDDPGDFAFRDFKYSAGGGIQVLTKNFFLFRLQAAYGGEGVNVVFAAKKVL